MITRKTRIVSMVGRRMQYEKYKAYKLFIDDLDAALERYTPNWTSMAEKEKYKHRELFAERLRKDLYGPLK